MSAFTGRDQAQKEFIRLFDTLTGAHSRWEVWKDMIVIFATTISNVLDRRFFEQREKLYRDAIGNRYTKEQQERFPELLGMLVDIYQDGSDRGEYRDFLGELFMMMELGNDSGGQFFTPFHVCKMMSSIGADRDRVTEGIERKGWIACNDPACGAGATLIAAADTIRGWGINYQERVYFAAQDIDYTTALMCYIQLSLLGCAGHVYIGNTLCDPDSGNVLFGGRMDENTWLTPMWFSDVWQGRRAAKRMDEAMKRVPKARPDNLFTVRDDGQMKLF